MAIKSTPLAFARFEETLEGDEVTTGGWPLRADSPELAALREMQAQHRLKSVEAEQLRQLLIDRPDINSVDQLRTYLSDLSVPSKHQTPEIKDTARRLEAAVQSSKHGREMRPR